MLTERARQAESTGDLDLALAELARVAEVEQAQGALHNLRITRGAQARILRALGRDREADELLAES